MDEKKKGGSIFLSLTTNSINILIYLSIEKMDSQTYKTENKTYKFMSCIDEENSDDLMMLFFKIG